MCGWVGVFVTSVKAALCDQVGWSVVLSFCVSVSGLILRKILDCTGEDIYGERRARAYNGGLGQSPQRGLGAEPLVRGSGGQGGEAPLKLTAF